MSLSAAYIKVHFRTRLHHGSKHYDPLSDYSLGSELIDFVFIMLINVKIMVINVEMPKTYEHKMPPEKSALLKIVSFFSFLNQNIFYGYSTKKSSLNETFGYRKHIFKLIDMKINACTLSKIVSFLLISQLKYMFWVLKRTFSMTYA